MFHGQKNTTLGLTVPHQLHVYQSLHSAIEHQDTPSAEQFYGAGCCAASMNSLADSSFADAYVHVE